MLSDDIAQPGEANLEFQASVARPPRLASLGPGLVWQGLAELAYGLRKNWEVSAQLPVARVHGTLYSTGLNAEVQYVAPHDDDEGSYWGGRAEIGYAVPVGEARSWQAELRGIMGYRADRWHGVVNPGITAALSGENRQVNFESSAKLGYRLDAHQAVGLEYFVDAGPISNPLPRRQRSELALLVFDTRISKSGLNIGLGKRMTEASDRWVMKLVMSFDLD